MSSTIRIFEEVRRWYDGYSFHQVKNVYNPHAIVKLMLRGKYDNYWTSTVSYKSLESYITMKFDGLRDAVIRLMAGEKISVDISTFENDMVNFKSKDDVLTVLIHLGYLAYDDRKREVYIPNGEVREAFSRVIKIIGWTADDSISMIRR